MNGDPRPLVSVLTPVYNGESYLAECIESVLAQTYSNWEYLILNNCSKDATADIALRYVAKDPRVRLVNSDTFRGVIGNHNYAFSLISPESKYTKVVSADDVIFPDSLTRLVHLAEENASVGLVGSYQLSGGDDEWVVRCTGLPYWRTVISGKEIGRGHLMTGQNLFGAPTSVLYRSDLVRRTKEFYPNPRAEADISGCIKCLLETDFGFVHQVLSFERCHGPRVSTASRLLDAYTTSRLNDLKDYGPDFLTPAEQQCRQNQLLNDFYKGLGIAAVNFRDREYWRFQTDRLAELGLRLDWFRLVAAVCAKLFDLVSTPQETIRKLSRRWKSTSTQTVVSLDSKANNA